MTLRTSLKVQLGTIDSGYTGDVGVIVYNSEPQQFEDGGGKRAWQVEAGDKIAQLVISPIVTPAVTVVEEFESESTRGANGFGSTDDRFSCVYYREDGEAIPYSIPYTLQDIEKIKERSEDWVSWQHEIHITGKAESYTMVLEDGSKYVFKKKE